jgi:hypothetical protein
MLKKIEQKGERTSDLVINDIEMNPFNQTANDIVSIQLEDVSMIARLKRLDGVMCLGKRLTVRRMNEETV